MFFVITPELITCTARHTYGEITTAISIQRSVPCHREGAVYRHIEVYYHSEREFSEISLIVDTFVAGHIITFVPDSKGRLFYL